ncbi:MAG: 16S rRNA (cytosine(1402)-N(4))-methyltransferase [Hyphomicrobiales bacterium]|nr:MAG: 16S rRNA (cytosine(1402)-N(4))-methyltransferase [Hyphomicrobiales bacterium]
MMANAQSAAPSGDRHIPVLLDEVLAALEPAAGKTIVDGTFGAGGYTKALLNTGANVIAIDRDPGAIAAGRALEAESAGRLTLVEGRFGDLDDHARELGRETVDGVVLDIGVSSMQIDEAERGFSFRFDGPLDMRMESAGDDACEDPSAADVVNHMAPGDLVRLIGTLGEEKKVKPIVRAIVARRDKAPILRTAELADLIDTAVGGRRGSAIHPATRTFQALRIYVNRELQQLADALIAAEAVLAEGGRLAVVTFHSLEDRIVKRFLALTGQPRPAGSRHMPVIEEGPPQTFHLLSRKPVEPGAAELAVNPRARSARLRAAERTDAPAGSSGPIDFKALGLPLLPEFAGGRMSS